MTKNEPVSYMFKQMWKYSAGNKNKVVMFLVFSAIANLIIFFQPLALAWLLNTIQVEGVSGANISKLLWISSLFLFSVIGFWIFHAPSRVIERNNAVYVRANYKKYMVEGVLSMPVEWHAEHHSGDTIDKIEKGSNALYHFSRDTFQIIEAVIRFVSSLIAIIYFNLGAGFIVILFTIVSIQTILKFDMTLREYYKQIHRAENATSQKIFDILSNVTTVIILRMERVASSEIYKKISSPFHTFDRLAKLDETKWAIGSILSAAMVTCVLVVYLVSSYLAGSIIVIGTMYALYTYVDRVSSTFFRFSGKYSDIMQQKTSFENAEEISKDFQNREIIKQIPYGDWKELRLHHLTFSYHKNREELHLRDISLNIKKGEKVAFIGESGSGKTTFLKLIRGLYTPKKIEVCIDQNCITGFDAISDGIALIPQDPEIFATTIRENITLGLDASDQKIKKYTDMACFTNVADRLPNKLDSAINEKGVNLSGGEKQRLALSRGLLACEGKEIILLDEPTSSVDSKNEMQIYKQIFESFPEKTIISTIHRLHLLNMFDTIYMFEKGRIIVAGGFEDVQHSPQFQELWKRYTAEKKAEK
jgi:ATP-binding cassette, subfamily B, bacterial